MGSRRLFIDSAAQIRFTLLLGGVVAGAVGVALAAWCSTVAHPASGDLATAAASIQRASASLTALIEVSGNLQLPAEQRVSLVRARGGDLAAATAEASGRLHRAVSRIGSSSGYAAGVLAAAVWAVGCGLAWSRRIVHAEQGIVRRLEAMVDGDLRHDASRPSTDLPVTERGVRRILDEMRSVTRRDIQLITEVSESVQQICTASAADTGISPTTRDQLVAAAHKIGELRRIAQRPSW